MPRRPAISIVSSWLHATHSGGCGCWRGLGTTLRSGKSKNSPWYSQPSSQNIGMRQRIASSHTARLSRKRRSNGCSSVTLLPSPTPSSTRPWLSRSSVLTRSATRAGWFVGSCTMPWPSRMLLGALAGRGEEHLGRRGVAVLLEEVVLDLPGVVVAEPVGELDLVERVVQQLVLVVATPRLGQLQLVEHSELHDPTPRNLVRRTRTEPTRRVDRNSARSVVAGRLNACRRPGARRACLPQLEASCACTWVRPRESARRSRCSTRHAAAASEVPTWWSAASTRGAARTPNGCSSSSPPDRTRPTSTSTR